MLVALIAYVWVYAARWRTSRRAGGARAASGWRAAAWAGGVLMLFLALISPIDNLGEQMASWHMVQHLLIADLAPILLILGLTKWILRPATRRIHWLEQTAGPFAHPIFGVVAYVLAMWCWHIPALYDAALAHPVVHSLEHLSFFAAGSLYWWHLLVADPLAVADARASARSPTWPRRSCSSASSASCSRSRTPSSTTTPGRATDGA